MNQVAVKFLSGFPKEERLPRGPVCWGFLRNLLRVESGSISRGWRGRKPAEAGAAAGPRRVRGALGGSPPPSGRSRGDAASCTLTCLDGPRVFVPVTKGEGCSLTPARGGGGWPKGPLNPRWIPEGEGRAETGTSCSKGSAAAPARGAILSAWLFPAPGPERSPRGHGAQGSGCGARSPAFSQLGVRWRRDPSALSGSVCLSLASR